MKFKLSLKQIRSVILIISLMLLSSWIGWKIGKKDVVLVESFKNENQTDLRLFWKVWSKLDEKYLIKDSLDSEKMMMGAIEGMTASLEDPYTVFLPPKQNKVVQENLNGSFEGVGIQLGFIKENLGVIAPLEGMPAQKVGIRAGDIILHIKDVAKDIDVDTKDMSLPEAVKIIRGKKGTPVVLTVFHKNGKESEEIEIIRGTIIVPSVELDWLENNSVAHLRLMRFGGRTEEEFNTKINEILLKNSDAKIILDLRNNPGGYLSGAVKYAGEFLKKGKIIVKQENSDGKVETYSVRVNGRLISNPLLVLINQGSASSSEILAGALRDHNRAKLIGEKSFGKGTVQEALEFENKAGLHITTAKWLLPLGQWVNETEGLEPDFKVEEDFETEKDEQLERAVKEIILL